MRSGGAGRETGLWGGGQGNVGFLRHRNAAAQCTELYQVGCVVKCCQAKTEQVKTNKQQQQQQQETATKKANNNKQQQTTTKIKKQQKTNNRKQQQTPTNNNKH